MIAELGIIEGYYGKPWSWGARTEAVTALKPHGYSFFIYAPKFDAFLRERWSEDHPHKTMDALKHFAAHCRGKRVRFGIGLSPANIFRDFNRTEQAKLKRKLRALDAIGLDNLALLLQRLLLST